MFRDVTEWFDSEKAMASMDRKQKEIEKRRNELNEDNLFWIEEFKKAAKEFKD